MVKNSPANAGDIGLIPGPRIPRAPTSNRAPRPQLLSQESQLKPAPRAPAPQQTEVTAVRSLRTAAPENPSSPREKSPHSNEDPAQPKIKK